jgi:hypothetical protein
MTHIAANLARHMHIHDLGFPCYSMPPISS